MEVARQAGGRDLVPPVGVGGGEAEEHLWSGSSRDGGEGRG